MLAFKCLSKVSVVVEGGSNGWQKLPDYEGEGGVPGRQIGRRCEYFGLHPFEGEVVRPITL